MDPDRVMKLLAMGLYVAVLLGIGVAASRRMRDMRDYFVGGKRMGFLAVAFSARATGESAWLLLGLTGFGAFFGVKGLWIVLGELIGVGAAWLVLSRRFKRLSDRYDSVTIPDYLESRFRDSGHWLRLIAAGSLMVFVPIYVSAQIHATGDAFEYFLGWDYYWGAIAGFLIVLVYVTGGGFVAVVWSDVFRGLMMVAGLVALPLVGIAAAGGAGPIVETLREAHPEHLSLTGGEGWNLLSIVGIVALVGIGLGFMGSPQVFVRFLALRSEREIGRGAAVALAWTLLADTGAVLIGIVGRALLEGRLGTNGESVLPMMVDAYLPAFVAGLYIAVVLAAIMSTIDSLLVVASSAAVRDYYQKTWHPEAPDASLVRMSRTLTLAMAGVALAIAMAVSFVPPSAEEIALAEAEGRDPSRPGIFWFVIFGWSGIAATFCPTIILSLFWRGMTGLGAKSAMVAGFASVPVFKFLMPLLPGTAGAVFAALEELAPAFLVSGVVGVVVSLADRRGRERLAGIDEELRAASGQDSPADAPT